MTDAQPLIVGSFLGVAVGHYPSGEHAALPRAVPQTRELATLLEGFGYQVELVEDPTVDEVRARLRRWREGTGVDAHSPVLLSWSGHGKRVGGELRLAARDTPASFDPDASYRAEWLVEGALRGGVEQMLVLIDTCHAGQATLASVRVALDDWARRTFPPERAGWLGVLASCHGDEDAAGSGILLDTAGQLLREGPSDTHYRHAWTVQNAGITGQEFVQTLRRELAGAEQRLVHVESGTAQVMFRNPRWRPPSARTWWSISCWPPAGWRRGRTVGSSPAAGRCCSASWPGWARQ